MHRVASYLIVLIGKWCIMNET